LNNCQSAESVNHFIFVTLIERRQGKLFIEKRYSHLLSQSIKIARLTFFNFNIF